MPASTTFRADVVAGLVTVLTSYRTSNPSLLRGIYSARPDGPAFEKPCAYIGNRGESVRVDSGIMTRTLTPEVVLLDTFPVNEETLDRMDILVDDLVEAFVEAPHAAGANTVIGSTFTVTDTEIAMGDAVYRAVVFTFADALDQEGRL